MSENNEEPEQIEESSQTRLHVRPPFASEYRRAVVFCDRATQTAITQVPGKEDPAFYALLEFIPYREICENSIRTVEIPRKTRLQFRLPDEVSETSLSSSTAAAKLSGSGSIGSMPPAEVMKSRLKQPKQDLRPQSSVQTILFVSPHVLENDNVATIRRSESVQTFMSFPPFMSYGMVTESLHCKVVDNSTQTDVDYIAELLGASSMTRDDTYHDANVILKDIIRRYIKEDSNFSFLKLQESHSEGFSEREGTESTYISLLQRLQGESYKPRPTYDSFSLGVSSEDSEFDKTTITEIFIRVTDHRDMAEKESKQTLSIDAEYESFCGPCTKYSEQFNTADETESFMGKTPLKFASCDCLDAEDTLLKKSFISEKHINSDIPKLCISCEKPYICGKLSIATKKAKPKKENPACKCLKIPNAFCEVKDKKYHRRRDPLEELEKFIRKANAIERKYKLWKATLERVDETVPIKISSQQKALLDGYQLNSGIQLSGACTDIVCLPCKMPRIVLPSASVSLQETNENRSVKKVDNSYNSLRSSGDYKEKRKQEMAKIATKKYITNKDKCTCHKELAVYHVTGITNNKTTSRFKQSNKFPKRIMKTKKDESFNFPEIESRGRSRAKKNQSMDKPAGFVCICPMGEECAEKVCNEGLMADGLFSCSPSGVFEQYTTYTEPYMDDLNDAVAGVQTDLALGDKLESESLNELDEVGDCTTKIEIPWRAMCLPKPGTYTIKQCKEAGERMKQAKDKMRPCTCPFPSVEVPLPIIIEVPVPGPGGEETEKEAVVEAELDEDEADEGEEADEEEAPEDNDDPPEEPADEPPPEDVLGEGEGGEGGEEEEEEEAPEDEPPEEVPPPAEGPEEPTTKQAEPLTECVCGALPMVYDSYPPVDYTEPYMEALNSLFKDDQEECGKHIEMPWKDIVLEKNVKIRQKMTKADRMVNDYTGMFVPLEDASENDGDRVLDITLGSDDKRSSKGAASENATPVDSSGSNDNSPYGSPKEFTFQVGYNLQYNKNTNVNVGATAACDKCSKRLEKLDEAGNAILEGIACFCNTCMETIDTIGVRGSPRVKLNVKDDVKETPIKAQFEFGECVCSRDEQAGATGDNSCTCDDQKSKDAQKELKKSPKIQSCTCDDLKSKDAQKGLTPKDEKSGKSKPISEDTKQRENKQKKEKTLELPCPLCRDQHIEGDETNEGNEGDEGDESDEGDDVVLATAPICEICQCCVCGEKWKVSDCICEPLPKEPVCKPCDPCTCCMCGRPWSPEEEEEEEPEEPSKPTCSCTKTLKGRPMDETTDESERKPVCDPCTCCICGKIDGSDGTCTCNEKIGEECDVCTCCICGKAGFEVKAKSERKGSTSSEKKGSTGSVRKSTSDERKGSTNSSDSVQKKGSTSSERKGSTGSVRKSTSDERKGSTKGADQSATCTCGGAEQRKGSTSSERKESTGSERKSTSDERKGSTKSSDQNGPCTCGDTGQKRGSTSSERKGSTGSVRKSSSEERKGSTSNERKGSSDSERKSPLDERKGSTKSAGQSGTCTCGGTEQRKGSASSETKGSSDSERKSTSDERKGSTKSAGQSGTCSCGGTEQRKGSTSSKTKGSSDSERKSTSDERKGSTKSADQSGTCTCGGTEQRKGSASSEPKGSSDSERKSTSDERKGSTKSADQSGTCTCGGTEQRKGSTSSERKGSSDSETKSTSDERKGSTKSADQSGTCTCGDTEKKTGSTSSERKETTGSERKSSSDERKGSTKSADPSDQVRGNDTEQGQNSGDNVCDPCKCCICGKPTQETDGDGSTKSKNQSGALCSCSSTEDPSGGDAGEVCEPCTCCICGKTQKPEETETTKDKNNKQGASREGSNDTCTCNSSEEVDSQSRKQSQSQSQSEPRPRKESQSESQPRKESQSQSPKASNVVCTCNAIIKQDPRAVPSSGDAKAEICEPCYCCICGKRKEGGDIPAPCEPCTCCICGGEKFEADTKSATEVEDIPPEALIKRNEICTCGQLAEPSNLPTADLKKGTVCDPCSCCTCGVKSDGTRPAVVCDPCTCCTCGGEKFEASSKLITEDVRSKSSKESGGICTCSKIEKRDPTGVSSIKTADICGTCVCCTCGRRSQGGDSPCDPCTCCVCGGQKFESSAKGDLENAPQEPPAETNGICTCGKNEQGEPGVVSSLPKADICDSCLCCVCGKRKEGGDSPCDTCVCCICGGAKIEGNTKEGPAENRGSITASVNGNSQRSEGRNSKEVQEEVLKESIGTCTCGDGQNTEQNAVSGIQQAGTCDTCVCCPCSNRSRGGYSPCGPCTCCICGGEKFEGGSKGVPSIPLEAPNGTGGTCICGKIEKSNLDAVASIPKADVCGTCVCCTCGKRGQGGYSPCDPCTCCTCGGQRFEARARGASADVPVEAQKDTVCICTGTGEPGIVSSIPKADVCDPCVCCGCSNKKGDPPCDACTCCICGGQMFETSTKGSIEEMPAKASKEIGGPCSCGKFEKRGSSVAANAGDTKGVAICNSCLCCSCGNKGQAGDSDGASPCDPCICCICGGQKFETSTAMEKEVVPPQLDITNTICSCDTTNELITNNGNNGKVSAPILGDTKVCGSCVCCTCGKNSVGGEGKCDPCTCCICGGKKTETLASKQDIQVTEQPQTQETKSTCSCGKTRSIPPSRLSSVVAPSRVPSAVPSRVPSVIASAGDTKAADCNPCNCCICGKKDGSQKENGTCGCDTIPSSGDTKADCTPCSCCICGKKAEVIPIRGSQNISGKENRRSTLQQNVPPNLEAPSNQNVKNIPNGDNKNAIAQCSSCNCCICGNRKKIEEPNLASSGPCVTCTCCMCGEKGITTDKGSSALELIQNGPYINPPPPLEELVPPISTFSTCTCDNALQEVRGVPKTPSVCDPCRCCMCGMKPHDPNKSGCTCGADAEPGTVPAICGSCKCCACGRKDPMPPESEPCSCTNELQEIRVPVKVDPLCGTCKCCVCGVKPSSGDILTCNIVTSEGVLMVSGLCESCRCCLCGVKSSTGCTCNDTAERIAPHLSASGDQNPPRALSSVGGGICECSQLHSEPVSNLDSETLIRTETDFCSCGDKHLNEKPPPARESVDGQVGTPRVSFSDNLLGENSICSTCGKEQLLTPEKVPSPSKSSLSSGKKPSLKTVSSHGNNKSQSPGSQQNIVAIEKSESQSSCQCGTKTVESDAKIDKSLVVIRKVPSKTSSSVNSCVCIHILDDDKLAQFKENAAEENMDASSLTESLGSGCTCSQIRAFEKRRSLSPEQVPLEERPTLIIDKTLNEVSNGCVCNVVGVKIAKRPSTTLMVQTVPSLAASVKVPETIKEADETPRDIENIQSECACSYIARFITKQPTEPKEKISTASACSCKDADNKDKRKASNEAVRKPSTAGGDALMPAKTTGRSQPSLSQISSECGCTNLSRSLTRQSRSSVRGAPVTERPASEPVKATSAESTAIANQGTKSSSQILKLCHCNQQSVRAPTSSSQLERVEPSGGEGQKGACCCGKQFKQSTNDAKLGASRSKSEPFDQTAGKPAARTGQALGQPTLSQVSDECGCTFVPPSTKQNRHSARSASTTESKTVASRSKSEPAESTARTGQGQPLLAKVSGNCGCAYPSVSKQSTKAPSGSESMADGQQKGGCTCSKNTNQSRQSLRTGEESKEKAGKSAQPSLVQVASSCGCTFPQPFTKQSQQFNAKPTVKSSERLHQDQPSLSKIPDECGCTYVTKSATRNSAQPIKVPSVHEKRVTSTVQFDTTEPTEDAKQVEATESSCSCSADKQPEESGVGESPTDTSNEAANVEIPPEVLSECACLYISQLISKHSSIQPIAGYYPPSGGAKTDEPIQANPIETAESACSCGEQSNLKTTKSDVANQSSSRLSLSSAKKVPVQLSAEALSACACAYIGQLIANQTSSVAAKKGRQPDKLMENNSASGKTPDKDVGNSDNEPAAERKRSSGGNQPKLSEKISGECGCAPPSGKMTGKGAVKSKEGNISDGGKTPGMEVEYSDNELAAEMKRSSGGNQPKLSEKISGECGCAPPSGKMTGKGTVKSKEGNIGDGGKTPGKEVENSDNEPAAERKRSSGGNQPKLSEKISGECGCAPPSGKMTGKGTVKSKEGNIGDGGKTPGKEVGNSDNEPAAERKRSSSGNQPKLSEKNSGECGCAPPTGKLSGKGVDKNGFKTSDAKKQKSASRIMSDSQIKNRSSFGTVGKGSSKTAIGNAKENKGKTPADALNECICSYITSMISKKPDEKADNSGKDPVDALSECICMYITNIITTNQPPTETKGKGGESGNEAESRKPPASNSIFRKGSKSTPNTSALKETASLNSQCGCVVLAATQIRGLGKEASRQTSIVGKTLSIASECACSVTGATVINRPSSGNVERQRSKTSTQMKGGYNSEPFGKKTSSIDGCACSYAGKIMKPSQSSASALMNRQSYTSECACSFSAKMTGVQVVQSTKDAHSLTSSSNITQKKGDEATGKQLDDATSQCVCDVRSKTSTRLQRVRSGNTDVVSFASECVCDDKGHTSKLTEVQSALRNSEVKTGKPSLMDVPISNVRSYSSECQCNSVGAKPSTVLRGVESIYRNILRAQSATEDLTSYNSECACGFDGKATALHGITSGHGEVSRVRSEDLRSYTSECACDTGSKPLFPGIQSIFRQSPRQSSGNLDIKSITSECNCSVAGKASMVPGVETIMEEVKSFNSECSCEEDRFKGNIWDESSKSVTSECTCGEGSDMTKQTSQDVSPEEMKSVASYCTCDSKPPTNPVVSASPVVSVTSQCHCGEAQGEPPSKPDLRSLPSIASECHCGPSAACQLAKQQDSVPSLPSVASQCHCGDEAEKPKEPIKMKPSYTSSITSQCHCGEDTPEPSIVKVPSLTSECTCSSNAKSTKTEAGGDAVSVSSICKCDGPISVAKIIEESVESISSICGCGEGTQTNKNVDPDEEEEILTITSECQCGETQTIKSSEHFTSISSICKCDGPPAIVEEVEEEIVTTSSECKCDSTQTFRKPPPAEQLPSISSICKCDGPPTLTEIPEPAAVVSISSECKCDETQTIIKLNENLPSVSSICKCDGPPVAEVEVIASMSISSICKCGETQTVKVPEQLPSISSICKCDGPATTAVEEITSISSTCKCGEAQTTEVIEKLPSISSVCECDGPVQTEAEVVASISSICKCGEAQTTEVVEVPSISSVCECDGPQMTEAEVVASISSICKCGEAQTIETSEKLASISSVCSCDGPNVQTEIISISSECYCDGPNESELLEEVESISSVCTCVEAPLDKTELPEIDSLCSCGEERTAGPLSTIIEEIPSVCDCTDESHPELYDIPSVCTCDGPYIAEPPFDDEIPSVCTCETDEESLQSEEIPSVCSCDGPEDKPRDLEIPSVCSCESQGHELEPAPEPDFDVPSVCTCESTGIVKPQFEHDVDEIPSLCSCETLEPGSEPDVDDIPSVCSCSSHESLEEPNLDIPSLCTCEEREPEVVAPDVDDIPSMCSCKTEQEPNIDEIPSVCTCDVEPEVEDIPSVCECDDVQQAPEEAVDDIPSVCDCDEVQQVPEEAVEDIPSLCDCDEVQQVPEEAVDDIPSVCDCDEVQQVPEEAVEDIPSVCDCDEVQQMPEEAVEDIPSVCACDEIQQMPEVESIPSVCDCDKVQQMPEVVSEDIPSVCECDDVEEKIVEDEEKIGEDKHPECICDEDKAEPEPISPECTCDKDAELPPPPPLPTCICEKPEPPPTCSCQKSEPPPACSCEKESKLKRKVSRLPSCSCENEEMPSSKTSSRKSSLASSQDKKEMPNSRKSSGKSSSASSQDKEEMPNSRKSSGKSSSASSQDKEEMPNSRKSSRKSSSANSQDRKSSSKPASLCNCGKDKPPASETSIESTQDEEEEDNETEPCSCPKSARKGSRSSKKSSEKPQPSESSLSSSVVQDESKSKLKKSSLESPRDERRSSSKSKKSSVASSKKSVDKHEESEQQGSRMSSQVSFQKDSSVAEIVKAQPMSIQSTVYLKDTAVSAMEMPEKEKSLTATLDPCANKTPIQAAGNKPCNVCDSDQQGAFKSDPVMAALESYEAEMKPLKKALEQLQTKIRSLNMPELKSCPCSPPQSYPPVEQPIQRPYPTPVPYLLSQQNYGAPGGYSAPSPAYQAPQSQYGGYPALPPAYSNVPPALPAAPAYGMKNGYRPMAMSYDRTDPYTPSASNPPHRLEKRCYDTSNYEMMKYKEPSTRRESRPCYKCFSRDSDYSDDESEVVTEEDEGSKMRCPFMEVLRRMSSTSNESNKYSKMTSKKQKPSNKEQPCISTCPFDQSILRSGQGIKTEPFKISMITKAPRRVRSKIIAKRRPV